MLGFTVGQENQDYDVAKGLYDFRLKNRVPLNIVEITIRYGVHFHCAWSYSELWWLIDGKVCNEPSLPLSYSVGHFCKSIGIG